MFKEVHEGWVPYIKREDRVVKLFKIALDILEDNDGHRFGLYSGDIKSTIMLAPEKKEDGSTEVTLDTICFSDEMKAITIPRLLHLLEDILLHQGFSMYVLPSSMEFTHPNQIGK